MMWMLKIVYTPLMSTASDVVGIWIKPSMPASCPSTLLPTSHLPLTSKWDTPTLCLSGAHYLECFAKLRKGVTALVCYRRDYWVSRQPVRLVLEPSSQQKRFQMKAGEADTVKRRNMAEQQQGSTQPAPKVVRHLAETTSSLAQHLCDDSHQTNLHTTLIASQSAAASDARL